MLSVEEFRAKYPGSNEEQVAGYAAAVAAEKARPPEKLELMPKIVRDPAPPAITSYDVPRGFRSRIAPPSGDVVWNPKSVDGDTYAGRHNLEIQPSASRSDLAPEIRGLIRGGFGHLSAADRAKAEQPGLSESDLLAIVAGLPTAADLEGADA